MRDSPNADDKSGQQEQVDQSTPFCFGEYSCDRAITCGIEMHRTQDDWREQTNAVSSDIHQ